MTLRWRITGRVMVTFGAHHPDEADFDAFLAALIEKSDELRGLLVFAGGAPNANQRRRFMSALKDKELPIAVIARSVLARGGVTAIRWFVPRIAAFSPNELSKALDFLKVPASTRPTILETIDELDQSTDLNAPSAPP